MKALHSDKRYSSRKSLRKLPRACLRSGQAFTHDHMILSIPGTGLDTTEHIDFCAVKFNENFGIPISRTDLLKIGMTIHLGNDLVSRQKGKFDLGYHHCPCPEVKPFINQDQIPQWGNVSLDVFLRKDKVEGREGEETGGIQEYYFGFLNSIGDFRQWLPLKEIISIFVLNVVKNIGTLMNIPC